MSRWKGRALLAALAVCLMLFQPVYAFAAAPEATVPEATPSQASAQSGESGVEEPEPEAPDEPDPENPIEPEPEPENPAEPEPKSQNPAEPDAPDEPEETDTVSTEEELAEWIEQHKETGGTVTLSDHVTITQDMGIYGIYGEITVDTGSFGLMFNGGMLPTYNVFITGEGVAAPVVEVRQADDGFGPSWNNTLLQMKVTATGLDGEGGTALYISAADDKDFDMTRLSDQGVIRSYGEGAVGLWLAVPMEAWCYKVEVFGGNSIAVYAPNGADLFYCKLTAEGDGASAAAGNDLSLDSCAASPTPTGVTSVGRRAMEESFSRLYVPVEQNGSLFGGLMLLNTPNVFLIDEDGGVTSRAFTVDWSDEYYDIDTGVLGTTLVSGTVDSALYGLGVFDDVPIELTVEIRDPVLPCISQIAVRELDGARYALLNFWQAYDPAEESVILWRSDDEGETWQDATYAQDILWSGSSVKFTYDTLEHSVWFQLEVTGAGESNIAILDERDGIFIGGNGGDRTGTDRGGVNPPGGGDSNGSNGNNGGGNENGNNGGSGNGTSDGGQSGSTPGTGGDSGDGDEKQPDSGNGSTPTTGEETNNSDGDQSGSKDNIPDMGKGTSEHDGSAAEVGGSADAETEVHTVTAVPADTLPLEMETEAVPAENPTAAAPAGTVPAGDQTEAAQTQPTTESEKEIVPAMEKEAPLTEEAPVIEEAAASFDPEQSAPEPGFSAKALTVFFLGAAGLCSGALLVLRFGKHGRWRREKP